MKVIVGIGNYGKRYVGTRHNVGFDVVDEVGRRHDGRINKRRFLSLTGTVQVGNEQVVLVKPRTYVNETGQAVRQVLDWFKLSADALLVVCDDVHLELGCGRARRSGSSGGHKGLKSVAARLGTEEFGRLRLGIGAPECDEVSRVDYVLGRFTASDRRRIDEVIVQAAEAVDVWVHQGIEACMNGFNSIGREDSSGACY